MELRLLCSSASGVPKAGRSYTVDDVESLRHIVFAEIDTLKRRVLELERERAQYRPGSSSGSVPGRAGSVNRAGGAADEADALVANEAGEHPFPLSGLHVDLASIVM